MSSIPESLKYDTEWFKNYSARSSGRRYIRHIITSMYKPAPYSSARFVQKYFESRFEYLILDADPSWKVIGAITFAHVDVPRY